MWINGSGNLRLISSGRAACKNNYISSYQTIISCCGFHSILSIGFQRHQCRDGRFITFSMQIAIPSQQTLEFQILVIILVTKVTEFIKNIFLFEWVVKVKIKYQYQTGWSLRMHLWLFCDIVGDMIDKGIPWK